jgi:hypothetical protein
MALKKSTESKKEKSIPQVNPVIRRIQTEEGWKRGRIKAKQQKKAKG